MFHLIFDFSTQKKRANTRAARLLFSGDEPAVRLTSLTYPVDPFGSCSKKPCAKWRFFSTIVLFKNRSLFSQGSWRFSRKKDPWKEWKWNLPLETLNKNGPTKTKPAQPTLASFSATPNYASGSPTEGFPTLSWDLLACEPNKNFFFGCQTSFPRSSRFERLEYPCLIARRASKFKS